MLFRTRPPLAIAVAATLTLAATLVLGIFGAFIYREERTNAWNKLQVDANRNAAILAEALVLPIWNFDDDQVSRILNSGLKDPSRAGFRVHYGGRTQSAFQTGSQDLPDEALRRFGYQQDSCEIRRGGTALGSLEVYTDPSILKRELRIVRIFLVIGVVIFDGVLIALLYVIQWLIVVRPIRSLQNFAEQVSEGRRPHLDWSEAHSTREVASLHSCLADMVTLLDRRYANLQESEKQFRALFHGSNDAMFMRELRPDEPRTSFIEVNEAACKALGYSREELLGMSTYDLCPERALEGIHKARLELIEHGSYRMDSVHMAKDGREILVEVNSHRFELEGLSYVLSVARDITERTQLETQLRHSQKMESVGLMAGGIAHDFNNILQVIMSLGTILEDRLKGDAPNQQRVQQILSTAQKAAQLTRSLLAFSRKQSIDPRPSELNMLVQRTETFLKRVIGEDIDLATHTCQDVLPVLMDEGQIEQVLMNLAANARDAMQKGGMLRIETELVHLDADFVRLHGLGESGDWALLNVSDSGTGMDESTRQHIFDPFFTTKPAGQGTGLGLSIVFGIVRQHRGHVAVYSEPGIGTSFRIYLPLLHKQGDQAAVTELVEPAGGTETILIAEDEDVVRCLFATVLEGKGYRVIVAADGWEALAAWDSHPGQIDLLLMDLIMPRMNGKAVYDAIRSRGEAPKVLFMSGYTADIIQSRGELDSHADLLMKPVNSRELLARVRSLLDH